ncbi:MAG: hypothetical protein NZM35_11310 [Chitinophagales bacterium]|nr:hypothetical protein [Chitinophagales bacterium]MDW8419909.1 hypothetical protein [Chitinophagales bacterium]
MENLFETLAPESRVWVFTGSRLLLPHEAEALRGDINRFVSTWTAHQAPVKGCGTLLHNLFVVFAADEREVAVSGCSIDSMMHFVRDAGSRYRVDFFNRWNIAYRENGTVHVTDLTHFKQKIQRGELSENTPVFNPLVQTLADFYRRFEMPYAVSGYKQAEPVNQIPGLTL